MPRLAPYCHHCYDWRQTGYILAPLCHHSARFQLTHCSQEMQHSNSSPFENRFFWVPFHPSPMAPTPRVLPAGKKSVWQQCGTPNVYGDPKAQKSIQSDSVIRLWKGYTSRDAGRHLLQRIGLSTMRVSVRSEPCYSPAHYVCRVLTARNGTPLDPRHHHHLRSTFAWLAIMAQELCYGY